MTEEPAARPLLSVVRGEPTPAELAAVVVVLAGRARGTQIAPAPPRSEWAAKSRRLRPQLHQGPGAWRASALPSRH
jgi:hypothetical protein